MKNTITEIKNIQEGSNNRIDDTEEWISELEDRRVEIKLNRKYKKRVLRNNINSLRPLGKNQVY